MTTIKSYTDLEQSKKLAEFLPIESADAIYEYCGAKLETSKLIEKPIYWLVIKGFESRCRFSTSKKDIPCWSLAALLFILDFPSLTQNKENEWEVCVLDHKNDGYVETTGNNPIDACYEMIIKLHKRNLL